MLQIWFCSRTVKCSIGLFIAPPYLRLCKTIRTLHTTVYLFICSTTQWCQVNTCRLHTNKWGKKFLQAYFRFSFFSSSNIPTSHYNSCTFFCQIKNSFKPNTRVWSSDQGCFSFHFRLVHSTGNIYRYSVAYWTVNGVDLDCWNAVQKLIVHSLYNNQVLSLKSFNNKPTLATAYRYHS